LVGSTCNVTRMPSCADAAISASTLKALITYSAATEGCPAVGREAHRGVALGGTSLGSSVAGRDGAAFAALAARRRLIHIQMNMTSSGPLEALAS
jgi:hypothetical protein